MTFASLRFLSGREIGFSLIAKRAIAYAQRQLYLCLSTLDWTSSNLVMESLAQSLLGVSKLTRTSEALIFCIPLQRSSTLAWGMTAWSEHLSAWAEGISASDRTQGLTASDNTLEFRSAIALSFSLPYLQDTSMWNLVSSLFTHTWTWNPWYQELLQIAIVDF